ncbi:MAG: DUF58 domain-containing protein [Acidimicrobiia bacterium]|nr:DUF58 domain-containing protein [Acidimicrobiia bacterium]
MTRRLLRPTALLVVVALVVRVEPLLGLAAALGLWLVSAWAGPRRALATVDVVRAHPGRVMWGDEFGVSIELTTRRSLRWLEVSDVAPFDLGGSARYAIDLDPGEPARLERTIAARRRGLHTMGPTLLTTGDLFSVALHGRQVGQARSLLVYPQIVPVGEIAVIPESPEPVVVTTRPLFFDPHRIRGVRAYRPGDPFRSIHWTSSASAGELLVKELEPASHQDVVVSVDMAQMSHPLSGRHRSGELAVVVAASLLNHYVTDERRPTGLRLAGLDGVVGAPVDIDAPPELDDAHLMEALEMLARVRLHRDRHSHGLLDPFGLGFGTTLLHVAGHLSEPQLVDLVALRRRGLSVRVIVTGGEPTQRNRSGLAAEGIGLAIVDRSADIGEWS